MNQKKLLKNTVITSLLVLIVIIGVGVWGLNRVEEETKSNLRYQLQSALDATSTALNNWSEERKLSIETSANNPELRQTISKLLKKTAGKQMTQKALLNLPEQKWLRKTLGAITQKYNFTGFVIIDTSGRQVAALLNAPVGRRDLAGHSDFIERTLKGETVISVPFMSEVPLPDIHDHLRKVWPTMFVATPIRDNEDRIIAVLSFRLRPEVGLTNLLKVRPGTSGETYAFNRHGLMLSQSRFESQLQSIGLLPDKPDITSILNIEIRDPGGDKTQGFVSPVPRTEQPLTLMAQSAISGKSESNVEGYNDYRGVPVVGAWTWMEDLNFGITHEIDVDEAYTPLNTLKQTFFILFGLLFSAALWGLIQFHRKEQAEEAQTLEQQHTRQVAQRMHSIFDNAIDAMIIIDAQGIIESFNPAAEQIFGYTREEITGHNVSLLMPEPYTSEHDGYLDNYIRTREAKIIGTVRELTALRKDGTEFFMELSVSELNLDADLKFTGIVRDISERKKFEQDTINARQEAEKANNAKSEFLSQMSHELRTPLNAILGFAQLMEKEDGSMESSFREECVDHILNGGKHLLELINDVLDLSRVETGNLSVSLEPTELAPLIREVLTLSEPLAAANKIDLRDNIFSDTDYIVRADRVRLRQVLLNLISNAIKYNRPGGTVTLSCDTQGENHLRISVADTGPGIPAEHHSRLFQPFTRLEINEAFTEGTGIGLTICKDLIHLMEGEIHLESEVGKGSTFSIDLALCSKTSSQSYGEALASEAQETSEDEKELLILYIEDNPANTLLVQQIMKTRYPEVKLLTTLEGHEGLTLARKHLPALILLDIHLPQIDGLEVFERLQQSPTTKNIPVVAISANVMESDIKKTLELGFDQYLTKPIVLSEFLKMLSRYLGPMLPSLSLPKTEPNITRKPLEL